jgi:prolipoprotein diacylglyceryltransferase
LIRGLATSSELPIDSRLDTDNLHFGSTQLFGRLGNFTNDALCGSGGTGSLGTMPGFWLPRLKERVWE